MGNVSMVFKIIILLSTRFLWGKKICQSILENRFTQSQSHKLKKLQNDCERVETIVCIWE